MQAEMGAYIQMEAEVRLSEYGIVKGPVKSHFSITPPRKVQEVLEFWKTILQIAHNAVKASQSLDYQAKTASIMIQINAFQISRSKRLRKQPHTLTMFRRP